MAPALRTAYTTGTPPAPGRTRTAPSRPRTGPSAADLAAPRPRPRPHRAIGAPAPARTARMSTGGEPVVPTSAKGAGRHQRVRLLAHPAATVAAGRLYARGPCAGGPCAGHRTPSAPARAISTRPLPAGVGRPAAGPLRDRRERRPLGTDHVPARGWPAYGRGSAPGPALGRVPCGPADVGRVVPPRRAAEVVATDDLVRFGPLRRALRTSSAAWSGAAVALTDGDRSAEPRIGRPVSAAGSRPRRTTRARGGRDA